MSGKNIISVAVMILSVGFVWQEARGQEQKQSAPPPGAQVNTQVGQELYGNNKPTNLPLYGPQIAPLPSEVLMATQRSGVLPSELLINSQLVGPLPQYGALSYIPFESPLQHAMKVPPPALWGPAWQQRPAPAAPPSPVPSPQLSRDVHYPNRAQVSQPPPAQYIAPQQIQPEPVQAGYELSPNPAAVPQEGTTIIRYLPTTQPASRATTRSLAR